VVKKKLQGANISIEFPNKENVKIYYLPFLGEKIELKGQVKGNHLICTLPIVEKGAVVWVE